VTFFHHHEICGSRGGVQIGIVVLSFNRSRSGRILKIAIGVVPDDYGFKLEPTVLLLVAKFFLDETTV
jgi:hypothetical protein